MRVTILGGGSWGTALAVQLARGGQQAALWVRNSQLAAKLHDDRVNAAYLPGVELPPELRVESELSSVGETDVLLMVVPSHGFRQALAGFLSLQEPGTTLDVVSATKGIETDSLARMSEVTAVEAEKHGVEARFGVLSGPTFAAELVAGSPSAAVIASQDRDFAESLRDQWSVDNLRLYSSTDVAGVEVGGTAKNVIAIAAGIVFGVGLGHNALAALITRGLHEITRLSVACGGDPRTVAGLAGLGDLVLTCTGELSRNRRVGVRLAEGQEPGNATGGLMVAEGVRNALSVSRLAKQRGVEMPIVDQVEAVIYEQRPIRDAVEALMGRVTKSEEDL